MSTKPTHPNQGTRGSAQGTATSGSSASQAAPPMPATEPGGSKEPLPKALALARTRALTAWRWIEVAEQTAKRAKDEHKVEQFKNRYGTLARKLPSLLQVSGLGQTLAFLFSKGGAKQDDANGLLFSQLAEHLRGRFPPPEDKKGLDFMVLVMEYSAADYRSATREAAAVAEWLKRFAEGRLGTEDE